MAKIDSKWPEDYIEKINELEKQLGHEICGCPSFDGSPCARWPSSALGRCLKHSDPDALSKILTGGQEEILTCPEPELPNKAKEIKKEQEEKEEQEESTQAEPPSDINRKIKKQKRQIFFWMALNIILLIIVSFLLIKVFYPELIAAIQQEEAKIYALAERMYEEKDVLKALEQYKIIIERYPDSKYYELALKRKQECLDYLKEANLKTIIQLRPKNEDALTAMVQLGNLYMERRQLRDAIEMFEEIIKEYTASSQIPYVLYRLSLCYQTLSEYNVENFIKAIELYKKIADEYPQSDLVPEALYGIGFIYHDKLNDIEKALPYYNEVIEKFPASKWSLEAQAIKEVLSEK